MVLAQLNLSDPKVNPAAKFGAEGAIGDFTNVIVTLLLGGAGLIFFAMLLMGAYTFLTAAGDTEKVKQAQKLFKFAVFGFAIVITSFLVIKIIEKVLGITILP